MKQGNGHLSVAAQIRLARTSEPGGRKMARILDARGPLTLRERILRGLLLASEPVIGTRQTIEIIRSLSADRRVARP